MPAKETRFLTNEQKDVLIPTLQAIAVLCEKIGMNHPLLDSVMAGQSYVLMQIKRRNGMNYLTHQHAQSLTDTFAAFAQEGSYAHAVDKKKLNIANVVEFLAAAKNVSTLASRTAPNEKTSAEFFSLDPFYPTMDRLLTEWKKLKTPVVNRMKGFTAEDSEKLCHLVADAYVVLGYRTADPVLNLLIDFKNAEAEAKARAAAIRKMQEPRLTAVQNASAQLPSGDQEAAPPQPENAPFIGEPPPANTYKG